MQTHWFFCMCTTKSNNDLWYFAHTYTQNTVLQGSFLASWIHFDMVLSCLSYSFMNLKYLYLYCLVVVLSIHSLWYKVINLDINQHTESLCFWTHPVIYHYFIVTYRYITSSLWCFYVVVFVLVHQYCNISICNSFFLSLAIKVALINE